MEHLESLSHKQNIAVDTAHHACRKEREQRSELFARGLEEVGDGFFKQGVLAEERLAECFVELG